MKKLSELQKNDNSREKLASKGVKSLNRKELLMVILGKVIKGRDVTVLAADILKLIETERENLTLENLEKFQGVGKTRAGQILASFEFAKRYLLKPEMKINNTEDVLSLDAEIRNKKREHCITITLTGASNLIENDIELPETDKKITKQLCDAAKLLGTQVIDHIIVTNNNYFSFQSERLLMRKNG